MDKPLTVFQAAEFLNLSTGYIYILVHQKKLASYKPNGKKLYFKQADLEAYAYGKRTLSNQEMSAEADRVLVGGNA